MSLYNLRNPAVKRLMKEAEELRHPTDEYHAQPLEDNLFEWHFTLRGPPNSDYDGGIYHGRITLPPDYPMKPPSIILLTANGRFETNKKICLSISGHHPESWQPSWSIRTALLAIIGFMPTHGNGAIGSLDYTSEERKQLAIKSQEYQCPECGHSKDIFSKKNNGLTDDPLPAALEPVSESVQVDQVKLSNSSSPITDDSTLSELPEASILNIHHSKSVEEEEIYSSVCRQRGTASHDEDQPQETTSDPPKSNIYSLACIWLIVFAIVILCLRRLFSV